MKESYSHSRFLLICLILFSFLCLNNAPYLSSFKKLKELEQKDQLPASDQNQEDGDSEDQTLLSQDYSWEAVFHASQVPLGKALFFLFEVEIPVFKKVFYHYEEPLTLISYLENTFCLIIAINAP